MVFLYGILILIISVISLRFLLRILVHTIFYFPPVKNTLPVEAWGKTTQSFKVRTEHQKNLQVVLCAPENTGPLVIGVHGYENTAEKLVPLSEFLTGHGYRILLVNTRNHGESDADGYSTMLQYVRDVEAVIGFSRDNLPAGDRVILLGHSLGAAVSLYLASQNPSVTGVISIASFASLAGQLRRALLYHKFPAWLIFPLLRYLEITHHIKMQDLSPQNIIRRISKPLLLIHGAADTVIPSDDFKLLCAAARPGYVTAGLINGENHSSLLTNSEVHHLTLDFLKTMK